MGGLLDLPRGLRHLPKRFGKAELRFRLSAAVITWTLRFHLAVDDRTRTFFQRIEAIRLLFRPDNPIT